MTKKLSSPLTAAEWQTEIENGLEYRRQFGKEDFWDEIETTYLNDAEGFAALGPNLVYSMGDALLSSLIVPDPEVVVNALTQQSMASAPLVEAQSNIFIKTLDLKEHVELALLHTYLYGRGFLKIGYDSEFGWDMSMDTGGLSQPHGMTLTQFDKKGSRIESGLAKPGYPWVRAVSPHDIVVPWGTQDVETAPWVAHRIIRQNYDIKHDPKYTRTSKLEPQISMEQFIHSYKRSTGNKRLGFHNLQTMVANNKPTFNELWEIHDQVNGRMYVISPDYTDFLRDEVDAIQCAGSCFVSLGFIRHPRTFWTTPQAYYLMAIQAEQYDIAKQCTKQRRINLLRFITDEESLSDDEIVKLTSGDVGAVARAKTTQKSLRDVIVPAPQGSNLDLMNQAEFTRRDARDAVGMSRNQLGEFDQGTRRTASEASIVQQGSQTRQSRRTDVMISGYLKSIKKVNALARRFWTIPRSLKVNDNWVFFTGDMLAGEHAFDISLSTKRQLSMTDRKMEALSLLSNLAQYPGVNMQGIQEYIKSVSNNPAFANFFLDSAQQNKLGQGSSSPMAAAARDINANATPSM